MTIRRLSPELIFIVALLVAFGAARAFVSRTPAVAAPGAQSPL
jgi:hypothetical protein